MSNIWKIYVFRFLRDFYLIIPIIVPFYHSFHFSNVQIFIIQAVFSLSLLVWEIPSGYFSDRLGRRITLILGGLALPAGLGLYSLGSSFFSFIVAESVLGFGFAMCSGTESALIYDTLLANKKERQYQHIEGRAEFITRTGSLAAAVLGGWLAMFGLRMPFYINIITFSLMFFVALLLVEPQRKKASDQDILAGILRVVQYCFRHPKILGLILLYTALLTTGLAGVWAYLLKLQSGGLAYYINGLAFAVFQGTSALGALLSQRISNRLGVKNSYRLLLAIPVFLFLQAFGGIWLLPLAFLHSFIWGFSLPFFLKEINFLITSDIRATVLSTGSMFGRCFFVAVGPLVGLISDKLSVGYGFIFLGLFFIAFAWFAERLLKRF